MWSFESQSNIDSKVSQVVESAFESLLNRSDLGFFNLEKIEMAIESCHKNKSFFEKKSHVVVVGLGGSSLGAKALVDALVSREQKGKITFLDNVDSNTLDSFLSEERDWSQVTWVICSKSGGTLEVLSLYDYCSNQLSNEIDITKNTLVISEDKESVVTDFAKNNNCAQLNVPSDIGGRFSVFTPVGLFPLLFLGSELEGFLRGSKMALNDLSLSKKMTTHLWASHLEKDRVLYSFQYCDRLSYWGQWLQQLWSESLGKAKKRSEGQADSVATFVPCRGASDQHSVLQQIIEGPEKKMVCFHRVEGSEKGKELTKETHFSENLMNQRSIGELLSIQAEATEQAIRESGFSTMVLKTSVLNEESISYLMMSWMLTVGALGELLDIDAFDQPGVESGKIITRRVLRRSN